ncbi:MAG TPA: 2-nitropropane dioxygenase, partial [Rhodospirillales bacterium]|nr:2-nitropropane dioxygenase [Rhodospirillales bacterium]
MTADLLEPEIAATQQMTDQPFGVNLITMHPDLDALIDVCMARKVGHIVLAGGLPTAESIARIKQSGAKIMCFAPVLALAKRLVRNGVDALIIEGSEAGGHIGPVSTSVLAQEILPVIKDVPVFIAGGIGRGEAIVSYLEMGASGVQLGTRFVCATEAMAHENFKKAFLRANARDAMPTVQLDPRLPVIAVRALLNKGTEHFMETQRVMLDKVQSGQVDLKEAQLQVEHFWAGALRLAVVDGDVENGSLMAGQSVGMVTSEQSTATIIAELIGQAVDAIDSRGNGTEG